MMRIVEAFRTRSQTIKNLNNQIDKEGLFPAGHYYSPIPSDAEVRTYLESKKPPGDELPGIELHKQHQLHLLNEYAQFYEELPFPEEKTAEYRYHYLNEWFSYADAIFLYCFLRKHLPNRIIEVGSGFSSALMLDTIDGFFPHKPEITCIDPDTRRLDSLMMEDDRAWVRLIGNKIQEIPLETFTELESGDLLFIDSSHVVKCGNDLSLLMFEILPHLRPGVFVHFHDVFYPFDYPSIWLRQGRFWNENYFLRAFLLNNCEWNIYFFNTYVHLFYGDIIKEKMPLCAKNPGGSLYLQHTPNAK
ncbi:MAG: class I SAM-dependent methyltransferase [Candidatus Thiodiazotropha sp.]